MARKTRIEIEGGLYHVITRGNDRQDIFHSREDRPKFLSLLSVQKLNLPFFLYAYCRMTNHVHLLIERRADTVGSIMHRLLTGYSQYYNRKYRQVLFTPQTVRQGVLEFPYVRGCRSHLSFLPASPCQRSVSDRERSPVYY